MIWRIPRAHNQDGGGGGTGGGNGGGGNGGGSGGGEAPRPVAYENFQAVVTAKNGLEAQVAQLKGELQRATERGATVDALTTQLNEWKSKAEQAQGRFAAFTELSSALGSTASDVIDAFDAKYKALPEANRPSRADWIGTLKSKPDEAPALLRPWLSAGGTGGGAAGGGKGEDKQPKPKVPGTQGTPPGAAGQVTAEQVRAAREKGAKTGDWTAFKELKKRMAGTA
jgi:hypothetical protein